MSKVQELQELRDCSTVHELVQYLIDQLEKTETALANSQTADLAESSLSNRAIRAITAGKTVRMEKLKQLATVVQPQGVVKFDKHFFDELASLEHKQWSHWTAYLLKEITYNNVNRWRAQMATDFSDLTDNEKESDREWARKVVALIESAAPGKLEIITIPAPSGTEPVVVKKTRKVTVKQTKVIKK